MKSLRVGFLSSHNYLDRNAWSGIIYYMYKALTERNIQVVGLGKPPKKNSLWQRVLNKLWKQNDCIKIGSPRYIAEYNELASLVQKQLIETPCDAIFAPVAKREVAFIKTNIPIVYCSDVTCFLHLKHYKIDLEPEEIEWEKRQEALAISNATKLVYPSEWAANSAISDYHAESGKIEVIPFGANIDDCELANEVLSKKQHQVCRLLFVGKDWERKGGNLAVETLICLQKMGIEAELVMVGSKLPDEVRTENRTVIPFLNKNDRQQRQQLNSLFLRANFFIFPTRADCSPIVICEANAFGLPVITTDVGGIPTIVKNGKNGYMLPLSATGSDCANLIAKVFSDRELYNQLVLSSREEYERRLNWNKWAESIEQVFVSLLNYEGKKQIVRTNYTGNFGE
ncbi:MAG TPA: glycosyl transferase [Cyanobacteria bacterium UBA11369]|nr:glycosyl transferase [Cyanobacteria bacterium UBA11371]HBE31737.1 glycosyl transferase [Cyanobacteria bacterium UBA11368]HBE48030.1 glycosyl transferase [Cyanobacteria bacterium UBA11369]